MFQLDKMGVPEGHKAWDLVLGRWDSGRRRKGEKERGRTAERKGAARGVVAVGWCGELGATVLPAQSGQDQSYACVRRARQVRQVLVMPGYVGVLVWEWAPAMRG